MSKKKKILVGLLALLFAGLAGVGGYTAYYYKTYVDIPRVYPGISIAGMDVGNLTREEEQKKIDDYVNTVKNETVTIKVGKKEKSFALDEVGMVCANPEVTQEAYQYGKSGNFIERIRTVHGLLKEPKEYELTFDFDRARAKKKILSVEKSFLAKKKDATITRKNGKFIVTKEVNGIDMDLDKNMKRLIGMLEEGSWDRKEILFEPEFTMDKAKHTKKELSVIKDKLGTFTTSYGGSASGRCANVVNGAKLINGSLLYPGDSFSVHDKVTPFNEENGYHLAGSYENGTTVQTYGGGICQVSTTLYNSVLRSELEVLERHPHSMTVHYVDLSKDAAISGEDKDLRFRNNLKNPIYIVGSTDEEDETITFTIYGKEYRNKNRSLEFVSETTDTNPPGEKVIKDKTLKKGKRIVEKEGRTGYSARLWKVIHVKGKKDKWVQINSSSYMSVPREVRVGTKEEKKKEEKENEKKNKNPKKNGKNKSDSNKELKECHA